MTKKVIAAALSAFVLVTSFPVAGLAAVDSTGWQNMPQASFDGTWTDEARRRPRVPGGSGCDDPDDIREHPECRV